MLREITDEQRQAAERKYDRIINATTQRKGGGFRNSALRACIVAEDLSNGINETGFEYETCAQAMAADHRTLRQSKARLCIEYLKQLAADYDEGNFDGRDEHACKAAKAMVEALEPAGIYALPHI